MAYIHAVASEDTAEKCGASVYELLFEHGESFVAVSEIRRRGLLCPLSPAVLWLQFLVTKNLEGEAIDKNITRQH